MVTQTFSSVISICCELNDSNAYKWPYTFIYRVFMHLKLQVVIYNICCLVHLNSVFFRVFDLYKQTLIFSAMIACIKVSNPWRKISKHFYHHHHHYKMESIDIYVRFKIIISINIFFFYNMIVFNQTIEL